MEDNHNSEQSKSSADVLFYDGDCGLCLRFKQSLDRLPGTDHILKRSIRDESTFTDYPQLDREACLRDVHLLKSDGTMIVGAQVITYLIEQFPGVKHFAWLIESNMGQKAVSFFHEAVDHYRKALVNYCAGCSRE